MNWNAIAAIGELAGAVAVVVSLLYLARQINQNTRAMRRTAAHEAVEGMLNWFSHALADPELSRIWTLGIERLDNPSEDEIAGFALLQFNLMKVAEDIAVPGMGDRIRDRPRVSADAGLRTGRGGWAEAVVDPDRRSGVQEVVRAVNSPLTRFRI
jgi:hypothetical protein